MRAACLLLTLVLGSAAGVSPESGGHGVLLSGRVVHKTGSPAADVALALVPIPTVETRARLEIARIAQPASVVTTSTDEDGRYALTAPEPGFWEVVARGDGATAHRLTLRSEPLFEDTYLPTLELSDGRTLEISVVDPDGQPLAGAWVRAAIRRRPLVSRDSRWDWDSAPTFTDDSGKARLVVPGSGEIELQAGHERFLAEEISRVTGGRQRIALSQGIRRSLEISDPSGNPLAAVPIKLEDSLRPSALETDARGRVVLHGDPDETLVHLVLPEGLVEVRLRGDEGTDEAFRFTVPETTTLTGQVLSKADGRPIADAWVYPYLDPARHVTADNGGGFVLAVRQRAEAWIQGAARGFLPANARGADDQRSPALALITCFDLPGFVRDPLGDPAPGVEITARPHVEGFDEVDKAYRYPVRRAVSADDGTFMLRRLPTDGAYQVTGRLAGLAPTDTTVRDLPAAAAAGGVLLTMTSGTHLTGVVVDGRARGVGGATLRLEPGLGGEAAQMMTMLRRFREQRPLEARSDREGAFTFPAVAAGEFTLTVSAPGFADELVPAIEIEVGTPSLDLGLLELPPGRELRGRVVDPDGAAIAGASIQVRPQQHGMVMVGGSLDSSHFSAGDGTFTIVDRREGELLDLSVSHDGFAAREIARVAVPTLEPLEVELVPAVTMRGTVTGPDGQPIGGASVSVLREGGASGVGRSFALTLANTQTDDRGRFELQNVEPTLVRLQVNASGWLAKEIGEIALERESDQTYDVELEAGATVEGRVIGADGRPVADAMVMVETDRGRFSRLGGSSTSGDGSYRLSAVEPGTRVISARLGNGQRVAEQLEVRPGVNSLDLFFQGGVEVAGRVLTEDGNPVSGALVSLDGSGGFIGNYSGRSSRDGSFRIEDVQASSLTVRAQHSDYATTVLPDVIEVADAPVLGVEIRMGAGADLAGLIIGLEPSQYQTMSVTTFQSSNNNWLEGRVDREGRYRVRNLAPGTWRVEARTAAGNRATGSIEISPGQEQAALDLEFGDGLTLTGRLSRRGAPIGGATVALNGIDMAASGYGQTDHQGRFTIDGLEHGRYRLRVSDYRSGISHGEEIELRRDDDVIIDLDGFAVSGTVTNERGGEPLAGVTVVLEALGSDQESSWRRVGKTATTDASGHYTLSDVPAGSYRFRASKEAFAVYTLELQVGEAFAADSLDAALAPVKGLSLRLASATGAIVESVSYAVLDALGGHLTGGRAPASSDGLVRLGTVPDGDWTLLVKAAGHATRSIRALAPSEELTVALEPASRVSIVVDELVDDQAVLASLQLLTLTGEAFTTVAWGGTPKDSWRLSRGQALITDIPPGRWIVAVTTTDDRSWTRTVNLSSGLNDTVRFD